MKQLVQALQSALEKEKAKVKNLKEQVCAQLLIGFTFFKQGEIWWGWEPETGFSTCWLIP